MSGDGPNDILDIKQFDQLAGAMPASAFRGLLDSFAAAYPMHLHGLNISIAARDQKGVAAEVHNFRGFAGNFGGSEMNAVATAIEAASQKGDWAGAENLAANLGRVSSSTWAAIRVRLESH
jgi:HPt (histidine-containing phosphotransfer) domain-containing protein